MMTKPEPFVCSICHEEITDEYSNNAWPINDGRCCGQCNQLVILARMNRILNKEKQNAGH